MSTTYMMTTGIYFSQKCQS